MPGFSAIIGQQLPVRLLQQFIRYGTIPHALLFTGISGVGKRTTANTFAMALNCRQHSSEYTDNAIGASSPCGICRSCLKISKERHPDVITLKPQKSSLRIDQIRHLLGTLAMKPFNARHRVVIIDDAQTLTPEAGNALLKVLEEPPSDTTLILVTVQKSDLLPTIISRCRHIHFHPLSSEALTTLLLRHQKTAPEQAAVIADLAGGSFEKARQLASGKWQEIRNWLIQAMGSAPSRSPVDEGISSAMGFAAQLSLRKDRIEEIFDILSTWLRDLAVLPYVNDRLINADCRAGLENIRRGLDDQKIMAMWEAVQNAQKDIAANGNLRLTMEIMALDMAGYTAHPSAAK